MMPHSQPSHQPADGNYRSKKRAHFCKIRPRLQHPRRPVLTPSNRNLAFGEFIKVPPWADLIFTSMAEALGVAGSIIAVVTIGYKVSHYLLKITDGIGAAAFEVRNYAGEIRSFCKVLEHVREEILKPIRRSSDIERILHDIVDICKRLFEPLGVLQKTLEPYIKESQPDGSSRAKARLFARKLQWVFRGKNKVLFYRNSINGHLQALHLILTMLGMQTKTRSDEREILKVDLEAALQQIKFALEESKARTYVGIIWDPSYMKRQNLIENAPSIDASTNRDTQQTPPGDPSESSPNALAPVDSTESLEDIDEEDVQEIDRGLNRYLNYNSTETEKELDEEIQTIYRKLIRIGSAALKAVEDDRPPFAQQVDEWLKNDKSDRSTFTRGSLEAERSAAAGLERERLITEKERKRLEADQAALPIKYKDPIGRTMSIPLRMCKTWELFKSSALELTKFHDDYGSIREGFIATKILHGEFDIEGPNQQIVVPTLWEDLVRPGWNIVMKLRFGGKLYRYRSVLRNEREVFEDIAQSYWNYINARNAINGRDRGNPRWKFWKKD